MKCLSVLKTVSMIAWRWAVTRKFFLSKNCMNLCFAVDVVLASMASVYLCVWASQRTAALEWTRYSSVKLGDSAADNSAPNPTRKDHRNQSESIPVCA